MVYKLYLSSCFLTIQELRLPVSDGYPKVANLRSGVFIFFKMEKAKYREGEYDRRLESSGPFCLVNLNVTGRSSRNSTVFEL